MTSRARLVAVLFTLAAVLLPAGKAGAVLPGTNGRIVGIKGPAFGNTQLSMRTVTSSTGAGSTTPIVTGLPLQHRHPTWSPDRTRIAFAYGTGGVFDIYTLNPPPPGAPPVTPPNPAGTSEDRPAWSPDGTRIAWESGPDIVVHPLNGGPDVNMTATLTPKAWK